MDMTDRILRQLKSKPQPQTPIATDFFIPNMSGIREATTTKYINSPGSNITICPSAGYFTQIGDAGTTSHSLAANDDLFVTGKFEVDGDVYLDGVTVIGGPDSFRMRRVLDDGGHFSINGSNGYGNHNFIFTSMSNDLKDHDHTGLSTNPTIFLHSATNPDTDNTQWLSLTHDQTDAVISSGKGNIKLSPVSGSYVVLSSSKSTTGDPTGAEGMIYINTFDNVVKIYADGAWRTLASW